MKKILLVEDDKFLIKLFGYKLKKLGYNVILLEDGIDVLSVVKKNRPNLIILDLMLPNKNGFDVLRDLKKENKFNNIPVIVVSQLGMKKDIEKVKNLGANNYLVKSKSTFNDLVKVIKDKI